MMFWIDIVLLVIFIFVVFFSYLRGFFKTILIFIKLLLSGFLAYFLHGFLKPTIEKAMPINYSDNFELLLTFIPNDFTENFRAQPSAIISCTIAFAIIFIILYIIFTIIGNILDRKINKHKIARIVNKLGGAIVGIFVGIFVVIISSFIVTTILILYNPTIAIPAIYSSFFLNFFVVNSIGAIPQIINIVSQIR